jgi:thiamine-monophosphate kinase
LSTRTVSDLGERALVERILARLAMPGWVVVGPGDDAAVIEPERGMLEVLTTDVQVEGVHFDRRFVPPDAIGHRALAVNLSDVAAMGATPRAALLSLVLPGGFEVAEVDALLDGLLALAAFHQVTLVGGNISRSPGPLVVDVTATGSVRPRRVLTRDGAKAGDLVYMTGTVGEAAVGLRKLQQGQGPEPPEAGRCEARYLRPEPRVRMGSQLGRNRAASSCMDLSDGLADAVEQVARASGVGIALDEEALPITDEVRRWYGAQGLDAVMEALAGGDDYELLFTVRPVHRGRLRAVARLAGDVPITRIGVVTKDRGLVLRSARGERAIPSGFQHFA